MRTAKLLAGLLLMTAAAGCAAAGDDGDGVATAQSATAAPAASATTAAADHDPLKFAKCMREQGLTWFPDPDAEGRTRVKVPSGTDPATFEAAEEACKQYSPEMDADRPADPEMLEQARQMAKCMRANGVPDFPDPKPNGSIQLDRKKISVGPGDPAFDRAEQMCAKFMPKPDREQNA